jgi:hypothetical protein
LIPLRYKLVWNKTLEVYRDMLKIEEWKDKNVVDVPAIQRITHKVISGFGFPSTWLLHTHRDFARRLTQRKGHTSSGGRRRHASTGGA